MHYTITVILKCRNKNMIHKVVNINQITMLLRCTSKDEVEEKRLCIERSSKYRTFKVLYIYYDFK